MILLRRSNSAGTILAGLELTRPNQPFFLSTTTFPHFTSHTFPSLPSNFSKLFSSLDPAVDALTICIVVPRTGLTTTALLRRHYVSTSREPRDFSRAAQRRYCVDTTYRLPASGTSGLSRRQANPAPGFSSSETCRLRGNDFCLTSVRAGESRFAAASTQLQQTSIFRRPPSHFFSIKISPLRGPLPHHDPAKIKIRFLSVRRATPASGEFLPSSSSCSLADSKPLSNFLPAVPGPIITLNADTSFRKFEISRSRERSFELSGFQIFFFALRGAHTRRLKTARNLKSVKSTNPKKFSSLRGLFDRFFLPLRAPSHSSFQFLQLFCCVNSDSRTRYEDLDAGFKFTRDPRLTISVDPEP
ncbi:hypothetical protein R3P38DRAFT_3342200 [Favolaschia claudopus]|uniref:Uncharacterized protein n=1 Tax=Favolaschia claudopus TaxID=2862362 RepID=A0AAW0E2Y0_9AGAR